MKIKVFGPNLSAAAQKLGQFHVHAADCADCKHYGYRRKFGGDDDEAHVLDTESKMRVVRFIYADIIAEDEGSDPLDYLDEFHFFPCCDFLPDAVDVAAAKAHAKLMQESAAAFDAEFIAKPAVEAPAAPVVEAPRLTLVKHPLDAALAALAEVEANVGKVNAGHERHFPLYVAGLRAYIEALRADIDDDNIARRRAAAGQE